MIPRDLALAEDDLAGAPRLFRRSTSASEWARAMIAIAGFVSLARCTTCPASNALGWRQ
jgi:hypothetical protein